MGGETSESMLYQMRNHVGNEDGDAQLQHRGCAHDRRNDIRGTRRQGRSENEGDDRHEKDREEYLAPLTRVRMKESFNPQPRQPTIASMIPMEGTMHPMVSV